ncbi:hypothetical protein [[Roseibacterium] beibuensis]|nr:hypothetical protein [Roseibacterium beibuensis]
MVLASGAVSNGNEGISAALLALDEMYDGGLEADICQPFCSRSQLVGRS